MKHTLVCFVIISSSCSQPPWCEPHSWNSFITCLLQNAAMGLLICPDKVCYTLLRIHHDSIIFHACVAEYLHISAALLVTKLMTCQRQQVSALMSGWQELMWFAVTDVSVCLRRGLDCMLERVVVAVHEVIFPHQAVIFLQDVVTLSSFDSVASCACCSTWPMKEGGGGGWSCCVLVLSVSAEQSFSVSLWQGDAVFRRWMSGILVTKLFASRLSSWSSLQEFVETAHGISCHVKLYFVDHECCMTDFFFFYQNVKFSFVLSKYPDCEIWPCYRFVCSL